MKSLLLLAVLGAVFGDSAAAPPQPREVTNQDIRDAILAAVHMLRTIEDKLERHEFRERALGDHLKKNLVTLEKKIKLLEPVKGIISRLDDRLATVETILMQKDERERNQLERAVDSVADIQKNMPAIMDKMKNEIISKMPGKANPVDDKELRKITDKLDNITKNTDSIDSLVQKIQRDNEVLKEESAKSAQEFDRVKKQLSSSELLLSKYEHSLDDFNNKMLTEIVPIDYKEQKDWQSTFMKALETQTTNLGKISEEVKSVSDKVSKLPEKNDTLEVVQQLKAESDKVSNALKHVNNGSSDKLEEIFKSNAGLTESIEALKMSFAKSHEQLRRDIGGIDKVEQVMMQTADGIIDTKRRVEYGVHQILLEVGGLIKMHGEKINATINDRFDTFELSVLDGESGALANLTSKIGQEIDQVWRQIGVMHQQMSASTDTLNKLQNQTDAYVNGSLNVMDNMKGKVGQITDRMAEVDENLNYLMGRLSLVTQEFNQIKTGLGKALDEIRGSFMEVQSKVKKGPGPHRIESHEIDDNNNIRQ